MKDCQTELVRLRGKSELEPGEKLNKQGIRYLSDDHPHNFPWHPIVAVACRR